MELPHTFIIQHVTFGTVMKIELAKNGEITKGYIYKSKGIGSKGTVYHFPTMSLPFLRLISNCTVLHSCIVKEINH
jgi:hypothetical protein